MVDLSLVLNRGGASCLNDKKETWLRRMWQYSQIVVVMTLISEHVFLVFFKYPYPFGDRHIENIRDLVHIFVFSFTSRILESTTLVVRS